MFFAALADTCGEGRTPRYGGSLKSRRSACSLKNQAAKARVCGTQRLRPPAQNRQTLKDALLRQPIETVACIAQTGNNICLFVQALIFSGKEQVDIPQTLNALFEGRNTFGGGNQADTGDGFGATFAQELIASIKVPPVASIGSSRYT